MKINEFNKLKDALNKCGSCEINDKQEGKSLCKDCEDKSSATWLSGKSAMAELFQYANKALGEIEGTNTNVITFESDGITATIPNNFLPMFNNY